MLDAGTYNVIDKQGNDGADGIAVKARNTHDVDHVTAQGPELRQSVAKLTQTMQVRILCDRAEGRRQLEIRDDEEEEGRLYA